MTPLVEILARNQGQVLTPELISGILHQFDALLPEHVCSTLPGRVTPPPDLRHPRLICDQERVSDWVAERVDRVGDWGAHKALGALDDDLRELVAGVVITDITNTNAFVHVAIDGRCVLRRAFLWAFFDYVFNQLDLTRITGMVRASNQDALRFDQHLGFELESVIPQGAGEDVLMLVMWRDKCRWLRRV